MVMKIDRDAIRELADILNDTGLTEIEVEEKDLKVRVTKAPAPVAMAAPVPMAPAAAPAPVAPAAAAAPTAIDASHPGAIVSPMVGTAYHSPEPGANPFITVGKQVKAGDTVMIIEAMKVMNPIKAEKAGTVRTILVADGTPVEYGEVLLIIE